jgi:predicted  nucleic acid-binding Zn-ribbon protein
MSVDETSSYKSPTYKLLAFFEKSRDKWKAKCLEAKRENRSLKYCLAKMTEKRDRWKAKARDLEKRLRELEKRFANVNETAPVEEPTSKKRAERSSTGRCRRLARSVVVANR